MDYEKFEKLKKIDPGPLFAVIGDEPFLKRRAVEIILNGLTSGGKDAFGLRVLDCEGPEETRPSSHEQIFAEVRSPSLFSPKSTVVVWNSGALASRKGFDESLAAFLKSPPQGGALVLEAASFDARRAAGKMIKEKAFLVECKRLFDRPPPWESNAPVHENPLARWIKAEGRKMGLQFELPVAHGLAERVGNDLSSLNEELTKLSLYLDAGPKSQKTVSPETLSEAVGDYNEHGVFRFAEAVGDGDLKASLKMARSLFEQGLRFSGSGVVTDQGKIAAMLVDRIHARFVDVFRSRALIESGASRETVATTLGKNKFFVPALLAAAKRNPLVKAHLILDALLECESRVKSGFPPRAAVESFLVKVLG